MRFRRPRASFARTLAAPALTAVALAGCGEIKNTINPQRGTANNVTVALAGQPNAFYIGLYEAEAQGYFKQSDMNVHVVVPAAGQDPLTMVHDGQALIGISSEPWVLLHRNEDQPLVGVAALVHAPLSAITIPVPKRRSIGWGDADNRHDDHGHDNDDPAHQGEAAQAAHQAHNQHAHDHHGHHHDDRGGHHDDDSAHHHDGERA